MKWLVGTVVFFFFFVRAASSQDWRTASQEPAGLAPDPATIGRLPPYYWAAFVISGDWR